MIFRNMAPDLWMSTDSGGPLILASYYPAPDGWCDFVVAEYRMKSRRVQTLVVFTQELYSTRIFTRDPNATLREIVAKLAYSTYPLNPVDLAYHFGGTVLGAPVRILNTNKLH